MNMKISHNEMINTVVKLHFNQAPLFVQRNTIGICNEVFTVGLMEREVIVRLSDQDKFLMGSRDHIPQFRALKIPVPDILFEDYSKTLIPLSYQIQSKIEGKDLGDIIETLTDEQLTVLAKEIASIFRKVKTIPSTKQYGVVWGGGDNELSDTWTERMKIWIDESKQRGFQTGVMDETMTLIADNLFTKYKYYFDSVKPITYYGDICSKNVMIKNGVFNGLVDLDGLTQGDPLEAIGRIKLSWYGTHYGDVYTNAIMDELELTQNERKIVTMYALLNKISWACENGIQFNQNTKAVVDVERMEKDRKIINVISNELTMNIRPLNKFDIEACVELFIETVRSVNAKDYTLEQLNVWAPNTISYQDERWQALLYNISYVAEIDNTIVGFGDMTHEGYLDRLFVHKDYQGQGVATSIVRKLEEMAKNEGINEVTTEASIMAKPFFEKIGYVVIKEQQKDVRDITLTNFVMTKAIL